MSRAEAIGGGASSRRARSAARQPVATPVRVVRPSESAPTTENPYRAKSPANRRAAAQVYIIAREKAGRSVAPSIRAIAEGRA